MIKPRLYPGYKRLRRLAAESAGLSSFTGTDKTSVSKFPEAKVSIAEREMPAERAAGALLDAALRRGQTE